MPNIFLYLWGKPIRRLSNTKEGIDELLRTYAAMRHAKNLNKRLLLVNSASSLLTWALKTLLLFIIQEYLLSRVSLEEYSLYPVVASIMIFVELIRNLLSGGVSRFIVEADVRGDTDQVTKISSTMFVIQGAAALAMLVLGAVFTLNITSVIQVDPLYADDARIMMGVMILSFVFHLATTSFEMGLFARERFVLMNMLELGSVLIRIALIVVLFVASDVRVIWVVIATETANVIIQGIKVLISRRMIPALKFNRRAFEWKRAKELLSYSSWSFLQVVSYRVFSNFDPIVLNRLATPFDVTAFHLGSLVRRQISTVLGKIANPIMPALIGMHALSEHDRLEKAYFQFGRYFIWLSMAASLPFMMFGYEFFRLYVGGGYDAAAAVMIILFISFIPNMANNMIPRIAVAQGRIKWLSITSVLTQAVNIVLTVVFVGPMKLGAVGSALASFAVSVTLQPVIEYFLARDMLGIKFFDWLRQSVVPGFVPTAAAAAAFYVIRLIDTPDTWIELILYSAAGECVFVAAVFLFFNGSERRILGSFAKKLLGKSGSRSVTE